MRENKIYHSIDENGWVSIYINDILHIKFNRKDVLGLYSYISESNYFYITLTLGTQQAQMMLEYSRKDVWEMVLRLFDDILS